MLEEIEAVTVKAEVAVGGKGAGSATEGDGGAGEVEGVLVVIEDQFYDVGVCDEGGVIEGATGGDHGEGCILAKGAGEGVDEGGVEKRFVALNVHDMGGCGALGGGFGDAVGAGGMVGAGPDGAGADGGAKVCDAVVVGGDDEFIEFPAEGGAFEDVLEKRFAEKGMKGLSGEAGGGPAGRDDPNDSCFFVVNDNPPQSVSGS